MDGGDSQLSVAFDMADEAKPAPKAADAADGKAAPSQTIEPRADRKSGVVAKRGIDVIVSASSLLVLSPVMAAVYVSIRLSDKGPALFWSERVGREGQRINVPKFRTMTQRAPVMSRESLPDGDSHTTRVGRFLRRRSLDELPQLWSVLRGDMSLIGPRPLLVCDPAERARNQIGYNHPVRPGITGLAQIRGRNAVTPRRKARYDKFYADRGDLKLDVKIALRTVRIVFKMENIL